MRIREVITKDDLDIFSLLVHKKCMKYSKENVHFYIRALRVKSISFRGNVWIGGQETVCI